MKSIHTFIFLILIIAGKLNGQSCLPNGIVFTSQYAIDNFSISYPGCSQIIGDVDISGANISNLNGLNHLTSIGGHLAIEGNTILTNLNGLSNLNSVGFYFSIFYNSGLESLNGIENLNYIGSTFVIQENEVLTDISAISSDLSLVDPLSIRNNSNLSDCSTEAVCNLIANGQVWEVYGNSTGCNSISEIESNCNSELIVSTSTIQFGNVTVGSSSQYWVYNL
jgi:hypothetical protein